jgi:uncharacterized cupin superfamily protein
MSAPEAPLERTEDGLVPAGEGWFVLNARESRWWNGRELGACCTFEGEPRFEQLDINLNALRPGEPMGMYHWEDAQEDFLVLAGEALLLVEGEERPLHTWDFVHCPAGTEHIIVGAGSQPCLVLAVGSRTPRGREDDGAYPLNDVALRHAAGVETATSDPREAYARFEPPASVAYRDGWLPGEPT